MWAITGRPVGFNNHANEHCGQYASDELRPDELDVLNEPRRTNSVVTCYRLVIVAVAKRI